MTTKRDVDDRLSDLEISLERVKFDVSTVDVQFNGVGDVLLEMYQEDMENLLTQLLDQPELLAQYGYKLTKRSKK